MSDSALSQRRHVMGVEVFEWIMEGALEVRAEEQQDCERMIGSFRRDCLDHVIILNESHLRRIVKSYLNYFQECRTHLSLAKDCPEPRATDPPENGGIVVAFPKVGGLHHVYRRKTAWFRSRLIFRNHNHTRCAWPCTLGPAHVPVDLGQAFLGVTKRSTIAAAS